MESQTTNKIAAITGHTAGIGKAIAHNLELAGYEIRGFSRSNGYDISTKANTIVRSVLGSDVFVNNAHHGLVQCSLFSAVYREWKHCAEKTIVNMLSMAKFIRPHSTGTLYTAEKAGLEVLSKQAMLEHDRHCRIINLNPSYVRTPRVAHVGDSVPMLTVTECSDIVCWAILQPQHIEISELTFGVLPTHTEDQK